MTILDKLGYQPDMAGNGKEALDRVGHDNYDIILMDVQMPEMDGLELDDLIAQLKKWSAVVREKIP